MNYFASRALPNFCKDRDDLVGFACQNMQQQIANKVLEEIVKGERIISLDTDPIKGSAPGPNNTESFTLTMQCRIEKLVRCKNCIIAFKDSRGNPVCRRDPLAYKRVSPDFFCADGKESNED